jgi:hypothetical protein
VAVSGGGAVDQSPHDVVVASVDAVVSVMSGKEVSPGAAAHPCCLGVVCGYYKPCLEGRMNGKGEMKKE